MSRTPMSNEEALAWFKEYSRVDGHSPNHKPSLCAIAAIEKQIAKPPVEIKGDCYSNSKDGEKLYETFFECPNCHSKELKIGYPCKCGQMINWQAKEVEKKRPKMIVRTGEKPNINVGDIISARGERFEVTAEPYLPDDLEGDSAIDEDYVEGEYIIPVNSGGAIYESEVSSVYPASSSGQ